MSTTDSHTNGSPKTGLMAMPVGESGLQLRTFSDLWDFAQCVARSGLAPKSLTKPEQILIALQWGAELGVGPMQALANIAVINGRPAIWGDLVIALVRRSGKCEYIVEEVTGDGEQMV